MATIPQFVHVDRTVDLEAHQEKTWRFIDAVSRHFNTGFEPRATHSGGTKKACPAILKTIRVGWRNSSEETKNCTPTNKHKIAVPKLR